MGAGYVLGADPLPIISFFARVGGLLASARAEAASLLQLVRDVRQRYSNSGRTDGSPDRDLTSQTLTELTYIYSVRYTALQSRHHAQNG